MHLPAGPAVLALARLLRERVQRAAWGGLDQGLSSLTNFVLSVAVARRVSVDDFGAFSIAFATFLVLLAASRSIASIPLTITYSVTDDVEWRRATMASTGTTVAFALVAGGLLAVAGAALGGTVGGALLVLGLTLMPLLLQDAWRFAFFAARRGRAAFANDLVWALALIPAVIWANQAGSLNAWILGWAAAGGAGGIFGIWQTRLWPRPTRTLAWLRENRKLVPQLVAENVVQTGTSYVTVLAITLVAGLRTVAALRAAQVLMNALNVATSGVLLFAVPEAVAMVRTSVSRLWRYCTIIGGGLFSVSLAWGLLLLILPDQLGHDLLGDTWQSAAMVLLPIAISSTAVGARIGPIVGLRALALVDASLRAQAVSSLLQIAGGVVGAYLAEAAGAAWGMAIASVSATVIWWALLYRADRSRASGQTAAATNSAGIPDPAGDDPSI
jgi:O-antigen/teichoic acid export membrane protein